jgi:ABC-type branched-subunit amino acid transport system ATPase component
MNDIIVSMHDICKSFPGVKALDHVDFTLRKGMALDHQDIIGAALRFVEPYVRELCDM